MSRLRRVGVGVGVVLTCALFLGMCGRVTDRGRYNLPFSSASAGPEGLRAAQLLAESLGYETDRIVNDYGQLTPGGVIFAVGGCGFRARRSLTRFEEQALLDWIEAGGTLVVAGSTEFLPESAEMKLERTAGACEDDFVRQFFGLDPDEVTSNFPPDDLEPGSGEAWDRYARPADPFAEGLGFFPMRSPARVTPMGAGRKTTLMTIGGAPAMVELERGEGHIVGIASAEWMQNDAIADHGAALLARILARYAAGELVRFDEYHLGAGQHRSLAQYLSGAGLGAMILQILIVVLFFLLRGATRFGAPIEPPPEPPQGTASYVDAVAHLYARSGDLKGVAEILVKRALTRLNEAHRERAATLVDLATLLRERHETDAAAALQELNAAAAAFPIDQRALVDFAQTMDALVTRALPAHLREAAADA